MLRGVQKRMIVCKGPIGSHFECAYFILRERADTPAEDPDAMMREVRRILSESERRKKKKLGESASPSMRRSLWLFLGGAICGALPLALAMIFS